ncbi:hypothetical protein D3C85_373910 [compost metagenome]
MDLDGSIHCRSERARDERKGCAFNQKTCVIVNVHREHSSVDRLLLEGSAFA